MNAQSREIIGVGHNTAPLPDMLAINYADIVKEIDDACAAADRAPAVIENDEVSGKVADLVADLRKLKKVAETAHDAEKAPFLNAGRDVDSFFRAPTAAPDTKIKMLLARQATYLDGKERKIKADAAAAEAVAREVADNKLREAERAQDAGNFDVAETLLTEATIAEEVVETSALTQAASSADLTRSYSRGGSVTSLSRVWTFTVENRDAMDFSEFAAYFPLSDIEKALRAAVKAGKRNIKGVKIFEQAKAR